MYNKCTIDTKIDIKIMSYELWNNENIWSQFLFCYNRLPVFRLSNIIQYQTNPTIPTKQGLKITQIHHTACNTYSVHDDKADLWTYHLRMINRRESLSAQISECASDSISHSKHSLRQNTIITIVIK